MANFTIDDILEVLDNHGVIQWTALMKYFPESGTHRELVQIIKILEGKGEIYKTGSHIEISNKDIERRRLEAQNPLILYERNKLAIEQSKLEIEKLKDYPTTKKVAYCSLVPYLLF